MTNPTRELRSNAPLRAVDWTPERAERVRLRIHERRRRYLLSTVGLGSAALAVAVAVAVIWFAQGGPAKQPILALDTPTPVTPVVPVPPVAKDEIRLTDGTRAIELGSESRLRLVSEQADRVSFSLDEGKGWFEVTPSDSRKVEVRARDVRVEVLGTQFVVEIQGDLVYVWVQRGKVQVHSKDGTTIILTEGEYESFPANDAAKDANDTEEDNQPVDDKVDNRVENKDDNKDKTEDVPAPVQKTELDEAQPSPEAITAKPAPDDVEQLWKAADAARVRGDHAAAITVLTKLLETYPDDARGPLAAFSLGRVILSSANGSPSTAARAFAKARKLDPGGPLVEDALLREVEAWEEAGDKRRVRSRTEKYMRLFPQGRYLKQLKEMNVTP